MQPSVDLAPHLERCFFFDAVEDDYPIESVEGTLPAWLRGTHYVNGPARFERGGMRYRHWLDGDGMVCRLHFGEEGIRFTSRFVATRKLRQEQRAGRLLYRAFGTAFEGDRCRREWMLEPPVNVSVYPFAGTLLAFGEQCLPYELDPVSLETRGEFDFGGSLNEISPFSAHPKFDPASGAMVAFGTSYSPRRPTLHTYEFSPAGRLEARRRFPLRRPHAMHDFALGRRHLAFYLSPLAMDLEGFQSEGKSIMDSLRWEPEHGSRVLVVPRSKDEGDPFEVEVDPCYCLHLINCFEQEDRLAVDLIEMDAPIYRQYQPLPDLFGDLKPGRPVRYWIDLGTKRVESKSVMDYDRTPDFPSLAPREWGRDYDRFWMLGISNVGRPGRKFFDQLARGSWERGGVEDLYQSPPGVYLAGEPVCVENPKRPGEACILVQELDAAEQRAAYLLFDAGELSGGPKARIRLRHWVHPGFHAAFVPARP